MQPNLFTMVLRHPSADDAIFTNVRLNDVAGIALGASPVETIFFVPAQRSHDTDHASHLIAAAPTLITATACTGGFTVSAPSTPWQDEVFRSLDCTARNQRAARRLELANAALEADKAKERARAVVLDHARDKALFVLEQRARLVGA